MKNVFITSLLVFATVVCKAQDYAADSVYYSPIPKTEIGKQKKKGITTEEIQMDKKLTYFFTIQSGALIGCKDCSFKKEVSFSASTIHGVTIGRKLRIGAGIGFDTYQNWQTMPLFGSVSWDLFGNRNKNAFFVQFNYGWAKAWASGLTNNYFQKIEGGRMVSTLAGYRVKYHDLRLSFGIGYKYQSVAASYQYPRYYYDYIGRFAADANSYRLQESMNRLSLTMIFGWK